MNENIITRRFDKEFVYYIDKNKVINESILTRIKKLHIPPKWTNVKISVSETDYLQATGTDSKKRVQYIYHPVWIAISKIEKYNRLKLFVKKLPLLMKSINTCDSWAFIPAVGSSSSSTFGFKASALATSSRR